MPINEKFPQNARGVIVTGASSGLGRELAKQFNSAGFHVILSGRNTHELEVTRELCLNRLAATIATGDLREPKTIAKLAGMASLYRTEYLVCCAAVYSKSLLQNAQPCEVLLPNLVATIELVKAVYPVFQSQRHGTIININSSAGKGAPEQESLYAASKHGLTGFFQSLRLEARRDGIRVMDVFIGGMKTPMMKDRPDWAYLIDPGDAAEAIVNMAVITPESFQVDELTLSRFNFPKEQK